MLILKFVKDAETKTDLETTVLNQTTTFLKKISVLFCFSIEDQTLMWPPMKPWWQHWSSTHLRSRNPEGTTWTFLDCGRNAQTEKKQKNNNNSSMSKVVVLLPPVLCTGTKYWYYLQHPGWDSKLWARTWPCVSGDLKLIRNSAGIQLRQDRTLRPVFVCLCAHTHADTHTQTHTCACVRGQHRDPAKSWMNLPLCWAQATAGTKSTLSDGFKSGLSCVDATQSWGVCMFEDRSRGCRQIDHLKCLQCCCQFSHVITGHTDIKWTKNGTKKKKGWRIFWLLKSWF